MLAKIEPLIPPTAEERKYITALQEAETLCQTVWAILALLRYLGKCILEEEIARRNKACKPCAPCPHCGRRLESKGLTPRRITTLIGVITIKRSGYRCPSGCKGTYITPLDKQLGIESYQQTSWEVKFLGTLLCVFVPYNLASHLLSQLTQVKIHETTLWHWVQEAGERVRRIWEERLQVSEVPLEALSPEIAKLMMILAADGVMVPLRPQAGTAAGKTIYREVKIAVIARLEEVKTAAGKLYTRLVQRRLVAVLGDVEALKQRLTWETKRQGIEKAPKVVWLSDGGVGFWRVFRECFSRCAVGILDFYHAASHLSKAAHAYLHNDSHGAKLLFEAWRHLLRHGKHILVLQSLTRLVNVAELPKEQMDALEQVQAYFSTHRRHIAYANFEAEKFPLGSGLVESACKWLIQQRFKGVGMRWSESGFENLLYLRLEWVNNRLGSLFPRFASVPPQP
jgi:hypothetical protein